MVEFKLFILSKKKKILSIIDYVLIHIHKKTITQIYRSQEAVKQSVVVEYHFSSVHVNLSTHDATLYKVCVEIIGILCAVQLD